MKVKSVPEGYHTITPYLSIHGVPKVIEFLREAFGAIEIERHSLPDGTVMNAEIKIGDSMVMLGEKPQDQKPSPGMLYMYVEDVDSLYKRAIQAGGKSVMEPMDMFYGDRSGGVEDSAGNQWWIATRKENLSKEEFAKRVAEHRKK
jgi:PhnB protein